MELKKLTAVSLLTAVGVVSSHIIYLPIGMAKAFPVQHGINLLTAVFFGPAYGVGVAFAISLLRNLLGTGSLLAFPGSMIGVLLAGLLFKKGKSLIYAALGEIFGTGILGALVSYPVAKYLMGKEMALFFYVGPFILSSVVGVITGWIIFKALMKIDFIRANMEYRK
ncbi:energy coupling factor transporter S component ThiW [Alkalibaculum bacchi]|uniref:Energy coupling factor transporter S component ThiW n=1 Tax=Alkalibaculum bacchi TaxID=645887 RepID=A0A366I2I6_9FIRM|nr:energy coupling factor transporter S component ThiW [Alkalibaculum bacchi]RBP60359.1 energy coupling factor transporter S component ThiW [Alkalibaculum bacchi]